MGQLLPGLAINRASNRQRPGLLQLRHRADRVAAVDAIGEPFGGCDEEALTQQIKLQAELGHDRVKPDGGDTRTLTKLTIAPSWALAPEFWSRPELRLFYTYARWNDAAAAAANGSGDAAGVSMANNGLFAGANMGKMLVRV